MLANVRRIASFAPVLGLLHCAEPQYDSTGIPFSCGGSGACPSGFVCSSGECIGQDTVPLPAKLDHSGGPFVPQMHRDPDRGGQMLCWTRIEDVNSTTGGVYAAFMDASGTVRPTTRLATVDTTGAEFLASCAPVPNSGGKILVEEWIQRAGRAETRVEVWTPATPNGFDGTTSPYYSEFAPDASDQIPIELRAAVVDDEAWIPILQAYPGMVGTAFNANRALRLRFNAAMLATGAPPAREIIADDAIPTDGMNFAFVPTAGGAWSRFGRLFNGYGWVPKTLASMVPVSEVQSFEGFGYPLGVYGAPYVPNGPAPELAVLGPDPDEDPTLGRTYHVAWHNRSSNRDRLGPALPMTRLDTVYPGGAVIGSDLYVVGAPTVVSTGTSDDGGLTPDGGVSSGGSTAQLSLYRVQWGSSSEIPFELVRTIPRRLGAAPVYAANMLVSPDGDSFALAWVEFYPPDIVGHGVTYALYFALYPL